MNCAETAARRTIWLNLAVGCLKLSGYLCLSKYRDVVESPSQESSTSCGRSSSAFTGPRLGRDDGLPLQKSGPFLWAVLLLAMLSPTHRAHGVHIGGRLG